MSQTEEKKYVTYGSCCAGSCGAKGNLTGCRFSLSPMTDRYVEIILEAIGKVHAGKVWQTTDKLSTVYRGKESPCAGYLEGMLRPCLEGRRPHDDGSNHLQGMPG